MNSFNYMMYEDEIYKYSKINKLYTKIIKSHDIYNVIKSNYWKYIIDLLNIYTHRIYINDTLWSKLNKILFDKSVNLYINLINCSDNYVLIFNLFNKILNKHIPASITIEHKYFCLLKLHKYDEYTCYGQNIYGFKKIYIKKYDFIIDKYLIINKMIYKFITMTNNQFIYYGLKKKFTITVSSYKSYYS